MAEERDANYQPNAKYLVEIDGIALMACEKVTFGDSEWGIIEGRTGADPLHKITSSGIKTATTITLEKHLREGGVDEVREMINWHASGSKERKSGAIVLQDRDGLELMRFEFTNGWVSKFTSPEMDATQDNSPMLFTFELSVGEYRLA